MPPKTIDSNIVGLSYAEEVSLGVLPGGAQDAGIWYPLDPNSYDTFGGEVSTVARDPINSSRQRRKGVIADLDAAGGFTQDLTHSNLTRLMQGFFFADARQRPSNKPISGAAAITAGVTSIVASGSVINVAAGKGALFSVGTLIKTSGFVNAANNFSFAKITAIATDALTTNATGLVNETYTVGTMEVVGYEFTDLQVNFTSNVLTLTSAAGFANKSFQVGEWIFIGGDTVASKFLNNLPGYARIVSVAANTLTLKEPTFVPVTDTGSGKTIQVFTGVFVRNEKTTGLIKKRSYQLERTLGNDDNGIQSEVLIGSVANEFGLNIESADKIVCDLSFVALTTQLRTGTEGLKPGDRTNTLAIEDAYNTSSDVYQQRLFVHSNVPTPTSLFAYVLSANISINNNASGKKAIGTLGSFDINVGTFEVSGNLEVYFSTVAAVTAVKNNSDVGYNLILAQKNKGIVYDIPLISLSGSVANVEKDEPIMMSLENQAAENEWGYTMSATYFQYLPTVAMPKT